MRGTQDGTLAKEAFLGGAASAAACIASNPIDGIRCRMQLKTRPPLIGSASSAAAMAASLQAGLGPAMLYNVVLNSTRFSLFRALHGDGSDQSLVHCGPIASGLFAGAVSGFLSSPLARLRTLRQAGDSVSSAKALMQRPFEGAAPWAARNAGHTACIFTLFAAASQRLDVSWADAPSSARHLISSLFAASVSCVLMNPLDVYCTRLYHSGSVGADSAAAYRSSLLGSLLAGYRGLSANLMRTVPHTVLTFVLLERWRGIGSSAPTHTSAVGDATPTPASGGFGALRRTLNS